jgi:PhzF family phenazine biosynthesis protein
MTVPFFHVDGFTDCPFAGNPAAVCFLPAGQGNSWLQAVAREMNLSETASLVQQSAAFRALRVFRSLLMVEQKLPRV